ncbi:A disintegrin and metalloproteinase with thrombospondin motifs 7-like [Mustelus asterias]
MQSPRSGNTGNFLQTLTTFIAFVLSEGLSGVQGKEQESYSVQEHRLHPLSDPELVHPVRVDHLGRFLSHDVSHQVRRLHRRDLPAERDSDPAVYYRLSHRGRQLHFNLTANRALLAPGFVAERRYGGMKGASISRLKVAGCHFIGKVQAAETGTAAISTCKGLKGVFRLSDEDYFIEPLEGHPWEEATPQPHVIYKRHAPDTKGIQDPHLLGEVMEKGKIKSPEENRTCGVSDSLKNLRHLENKREKWETKQRKRRRIQQRSISQEKWVESLVVADSKMVEHHGSENIEAYVLTVMNMVAGLFRDASIGNAVNIVIVRLVLLEEDEEDLKITHHADNTLTSFCKWQKKVNIKGDNHPTHHDVALLLTRKDICAGMNRPCETLGLSHVSGMCQPHRSCSINEDSGLPLAFTVAHELGHNFGIQHDGTANDCEPIGKRPFIMSPQLLYDTSPLTWSRCSREYITRFLDRGWGLCLDDLPTKEAIELPSVAPGVLYDVNHQCRLQYGVRSVFCDNMDSVCNTLWCTVGNTCHSKLDAAVDGTKCGEDKWCFDGDCISTEQRPESTNGNWGAWGSWSLCSRTCSAGIQSAERHCNNPTPKYGGSYCLGERKRFRICNIKACVSETPSFRQIQCSQFDTMPYKGKLLKWIPVLSRVNPCELHCRPADGYFSEKMLDAVIDGTPCFEGNASRDMCINGICKNVGCDYEIDSNALEDRCGVCQGNGSTCETVKKTFDKTEGLGYVDIGLIPEGAREIRIEEVAEAGNFLALRSDDPEKYFLNGGWIIQWNGDYKVAGTTFTYERNGNLENLTSPGPTKEPVWIQLLFQEVNPGVRFEYTVRRDLDHENEIQPPEFFWRYGLWTECTATCGGGVQRQIVHCLEKIVGIVEEQYCDFLTRPDDQQRGCHPEPCPARWWVGEWQACSASCGARGIMKRTALCIQSVGLDEQRALQASDCQHMAKPEATSPCNREIPCPSDWSAGSWSECSVTCGEGVRRRNVLCLNNTNMTCSFEMKPAAKDPCHLKPCPRHSNGLTLHDWSGSGGSSRELYNEVGFNLNFGPSKTAQEDNLNQIVNIPNPHSSNLKVETPEPHPSEDKLNNHIIEDDFAVDSSKDENSAKTNIFVDDFYYDYNFINFHEDLDYDPEERFDVEEEEKTREDSKHEEEHSEISNILNNVWENIPDQRKNGTSDDWPGPDGLGKIHSKANEKPSSQDEIGTTNNPMLNSTSEANSVDIQLSEEHLSEHLRVTEITPSISSDAENEDGQEELYEEDELLPVQNTTGHGVMENTSPGFSSSEDQGSIHDMIRPHSPHYHNDSSLIMTTSSPNNHINIPNTSQTWRQELPVAKWNNGDHSTSEHDASNSEHGASDSKYGTSDSEHGASDSEHSASDSEHGASNSELGASNSEYGTSDSEHGASDSEHDASNSEYGASDSEYGASDSEHGAIISEHGAIISEHGASDSEHGASDSEHGASDSEHGASDSEHGASDSEHGTSDSEHGTSSNEHGASDIEHGARDSEHGASDSEHGASDSEHGASNSEHGASNSEHGASNSEHGASDSEHGTSDSEHGTSSNEHGASDSEHGASDSEHGASDSEHGASDSEHGASDSEHGASDSEHGASDSEHGASDSEHGASDSEHGASDSEHGTSDSEHGTSSNEHGASDSEHGASDSEHGASDSEHGASNSEYGASNSEYGASDSEHGASDSEHGTSDSEHGASNSEHGASNSEHGASDSEHGASDSEHGASDSEHGASSNEHGASDSEHGASNSEHGASDSEHGASDSEHGASDSEHGASDSEHGASNSEHGESSSVHGASDNEQGASDSEHGASDSEHGARNTEHGASSSEHGASDSEQDDPHHVDAEVYTHSSDRREQGRNLQSEKNVDKDMNTNLLNQDGRVQKGWHQIRNEEAHFPSSTLGNSYRLSDTAPVGDSQSPHPDVNNKNTEGAFNKNLNHWGNLGRLPAITSTVTPKPSIFIDPNAVPASEVMDWPVKHGQTLPSTPEWQSSSNSLGLPGNVVLAGESGYRNARKGHSHHHSPATQTSLLLTPPLATSVPLVFPETSRPLRVSTSPVTSAVLPNPDSRSETQSTTGAIQSNHLQPARETHSRHSFAQTASPHLRLTTRRSPTPANLHQERTRSISPSVDSVGSRRTTSPAHGSSSPNLATAASLRSTSHLTTSLTLRKRTQPSATVSEDIPRTAIMGPRETTSTIQPNIEAMETVTTDLTKWSSDGRTVKLGKTDLGDSDSDIRNDSQTTTVSSWPVAAPETHPPALSGHEPLSASSLEVQTTSTSSVMEAATKPISEGSEESSAYWVIGNWSECSTTCGMGAIWRTVHCSTGSDSNCNKTKRPVPARRCYIRPCSAWRVGNWSRCSRNCGGGVKVRDVQCIDTRDRRHLRPFHCQSVLIKPPTSLACNSKQCMDWYMSAWGECSKACDGGVQERLVMCPEHGRCDEMLRLNSTRMCNIHPCTKWMKGSWGRCTVRCGGGIQRRLVKCVNTVTGQAEEDSSRCDHEPWPENTQKCNLQECDTSEQSYVCERDRLTFTFCQTLKLLGRCYLQTVRAQCCQTCRPNGVRDRGNERVSRR